MELVGRLVAFVGLIVLSPLFAVIAIIVRWRLGRPVLFRQTRPGWRGHPFQLVKFRTMSDERDGSGGLLPDSMRLPAFGRWLRSTSLDELPELWNIVRGEMCWVGPRPLLMEYLPLYSPRQARRHDVKPGITGWAQVHGRNTLPWEDRLEMDVWYVEHRSVWVDVRILALTASRVIRRQGINAEGAATMPPFTGSSARP